MRLIKYRSTRFTPRYDHSYPQRRPTRARASQRITSNSSPSGAHSKEGVRTAA